MRRRELLLEVPQRRGGPEVLTDAPAPAAEAVTGMRARARAARARGRRARDLRPRPGARHRLLHRRRVRGLRPRARRPDRRRRALRRPARALRPQRCPRSASRWASIACTWRSPARSAARGAARAPGRRRSGVAARPRTAPRQPGVRRSEPLAPRTASRSRFRAARCSTARSTCSRALGLDTEELRANDRKLLFEDIGVITMRPSDVPTYVEAGRGRPRRHRQGRAARAGRAGVPARRGREVYELLDLGYGRCTMVLASKAGPDPALEALRRLGVMRVATKYPRIAARYLEETGRQAEIVEVKGSVELAPLTGMVEAIVDLTATGHDAAREQPGRARGDRRLHGPADRQPGRAQAQGGADRRPARAAARPARPRAAPEMRIERLDAARVDQLGGPPAPPRSCARSCRAARSVRERGRARSSSACAREGDRGGARLHARGSTPPGPSRRRCVVAAEELDEAIVQLPLELVAGLQVAIANVAQVAAGRRGRGRRGRAAAGPARRAARGAGRLGRRLRARRPRAVPEHGRDGRRHRARGGRGRRRRLRAARRRREIDPAILGACRLCGVERVYRMGGAQAIAALAYGTETRRAGRRDRRAGQPLRAGGQAPALGAASGSTASPARATCSCCSARTRASASCGWPRSTCSRRASTARAASSSRSSPGRAACATRSRPTLERARASTPDGRRGRVSRWSRCVARGARRSSSRTRSRPSTCS